MLKFIFILSIIGYTFGQKLGIGTCFDVNTVENFDPKKFNGTWYVQYETNSLLGQGIRCQTHNYHVNRDGTITDNASATGFLLNPKWQYTLNRTDPQNAAKWSSTLQFVPIQTPIWILSTDYKSYAAIWSCRDIAILNIQFGWILTRERNPSHDVLSKARNVFQQNNLDVDQFKRDSQSDCSN